MALGEYLEVYDAEMEGMASGAETVPVPRLSMSHLQIRQKSDFYVTLDCK